MGNCHDTPHSPGSPKFACRPLRTKTIFDGTKLPVEGRRSKTTTYGRKSTFRLSASRSIMRRIEIDRRTLRHNPGRIDHRMARVVVPLDLREAHSLGNARNLVQLEQIVPQIRRIDDPPQI